MIEINKMTIMQIKHFLTLALFPIALTLTHLQDSQNSKNIPHQQA